MLTEKEIQDGNKAIADFVDRYKGCLISDCEDAIEVSRKISKWGNDEVITREFTYADLRYHTSWNWLMPVVEKIEDGQWRFEIGKHLVRVLYANSRDSVIEIDDDTFETKIEAVYRAVLAFISLNPK